jgi:hypothetical protein
MGRTIPSLRISSVIEVKEWKALRNSLDKSDRKLFDQVFSDVGTRYYITTKLSKRGNYYYTCTIFTWVCRYISQALWSRTASAKSGPSA